MFVTAAAAETASQHAILLTATGVMKEIIRFEINQECLLAYLILSNIYIGSSNLKSGTLIKSLHANVLSEKCVARS